MPPPWTGNGDGSLLDGIGWPNACAAIINNHLELASEYDKLGSSTAITITTLIPVLLSLWCIPTAAIHELVLMGKPIIAAITAGLTFGLSVRQVTLIPEHRYLSTSRIFDIAGRDDIRRGDFPPHTLDILNQTSNQGDSEQNSPSLCTTSRFNSCASNSAIFCVVQILLFLSMYGITYFWLEWPGFSIWTCPGAGIRITLGFLVITIIVVGSAWLIAIQLLWKTNSAVTLAGFKTLIIFPRLRNPLLTFLPGVFQAGMTVAFTFLFSGLYAASMKAALIRSAIVVIFLAISRAYSIQAAKSCSESSRLIIITCDTKAQYASIWEELYRRLNPGNQSSTSPLQAIPLQTSSDQSQSDRPLAESGNGSPLHTRSPIPTTGHGKPPLADNRQSLTNTEVGQQKGDMEMGPLGRNDGLSDNAN